jgi:hypothetical protein
MILDKRGGCHGYHVSERSVVLGSSQSASLN